ncbi:hypothetical protein ACFLZ2_02060 [Candidatus Margulisiibacteriota bacterium]
MTTPIEKVKSLSNMMLCLFVFSKVVIGFGLGVLLASYVMDLGWWIIGAGIVLSLPGWKKVLLG